MINSISLSGNWKLHIETECGGIPAAYEDFIDLPDTLSNAKKVPYTDWKADGFLTDAYPYEGYAWFSRTIEVNDDYSDKNVFLFLERTRISTVYVDGCRVGSFNSLCSAHSYNIGSYLTKGRHELVICVSNVNYPTKGGHMTSPDTQTNWLGITGKLELQIFPKAYISDVRITAGSDGIAKVSGCINGAENGSVKASVSAPDGSVVYSGDIACCGEKFSGEIKIDSPLLWDEFDRNIYTLRFEAMGDTYSASFGFRTFSNDGRKLLINGSEAFLRGKHDGLIWPLTGYAPCDVDSWVERLSIAKNYGINHYRFHTCCPPDAAFTAADMVGIYMEPELPFWGTIAGKGEEGYNEEEQEYLISEGKRIIAEFSHHPSFVMMSLGNELWGSRERLGEIISILREGDPSIYFTSGSNNFQFWPAEIPEEDFFTGVRLSKDRLFRGSYATCDAPLGHIQTDAPNTSHNYDDIISGKAGSDEQNGGTIQIQYGTGVKTVSVSAADGSYIPNKPVISHEVGQYDFFPDFDEASRYTGPLKPRYLDIFRETLEKSSLFGQWRDFYKAVGALCTDCYKNEIETALRSKELSGFQLLDLQDFNGQGVSLVGILNALMESKGFITPEAWRGFCDSSVLLAEMDKYVFSSKEDLNVSFLLSSYGSEKVKSGTMTYHLKGSEINEKGIIDFTANDERLTKIGSASISLKAVSVPQKAVLTLESGKMKNSYDLWLYPETDVVITENGMSYNGSTVKFVRDIETAKAAIAEGEKALVISDGSNSIENTYCADFWNYHMFRVISENMNKPVAPGTMGLLIDNENSLLKDFPSEKYSTPQWFELVMHSVADVLDDCPDIKPVVQVVDNTERCHRLGMLYKKDGVIVCTVKLWEISDKAEVKQFAKNLIINI